MEYCVLCNHEVKWRDRDSLTVFDTYQTVCQTCKKQFLQALPLKQSEMCQQMLESPYLNLREDVEKYQKEVAGKNCPVCNYPMERKHKNFQLGADGYGGLSSTGLPQYLVDLYACPKCEKVELYTARFQSSEE